MKISEKEDQFKYIFKYDWEIVVKGFWNKYPCPEIDFVKWNKVVGMMMNYDNTMQVKRLVFTQKFKYLWILTLEDLKLDFNNKILEMQTQMIIKSNLFPSLSGFEKVCYQQYQNNQTLYTKFLQEDSNFVMKYANQFNTSFKRGINVIEDKCRDFCHKKDRL